jgi:hypothetical protein
MAESLSLKYAERESKRVCAFDKVMAIVPAPKALAYEVSGQERISCFIPKLQPKNNRLG